MKTQVKTDKRIEGQEILVAHGEATVAMTRPGIARRRHRPALRSVNVETRGAERDLVVLPLQEVAYDVDPVRLSPVVSPRVMVCGDCGGYLGRLLQHRSVEVLTAVDTVTASPVDRDDLCRAYVTPWSLPDGHADQLLAMLTRLLPAPLPCVVLVEELDGEPAEEALSAGASAVRRDDLPGLIAELSHLLGTPYGDSARVPFVSPVTIRIPGHEADVEATDLRPGGLGLRGVPFEVGPQLARLSFILGERLIELWGVAVREWRVFGAWHSAFRFVGLSPELRRWMRDQVEPMEVDGPVEPQQTLTSEWRREVRGLVTSIRRPFSPWDEEDK